MEEKNRKLDEIIAYILTVNGKEDIKGDRINETLVLLRSNYTHIRSNLKRFELSKFLYYSCLYFDRFVIPTQYFIKDDHYKFFKTSLKLLRKIESEVKNPYQNTLALELDLIHWDIYTALDEDSSIDFENLKKQLKILDEKSKYLDENKLEEYNAKSSKVKSLLCGIENDNLFVNLSFKIPIIPYKQKTKIQTIYSKKSIEVVFEPTSYDVKSTIQISPESIASTYSSSNWQLGHSDVSIKIKGFKDLLKTVDSLHIEVDSNLNEHHLLYQYIYHLITDILWSSKVNGHLSKANWLIEPNDIESVIFEVESCKEQIEWIHFPFKNSISIENKKTDTKHIYIDLSKPIDWHTKCIFLAKDYLSYGNSNLCIFWLNIGIESFFQKKIDTIMKSDNTEDTSLLEEDYYHKARAELKRLNSNDIYNKIKWPDPEYRKISMFKCIKKIGQSGLLSISAKEINRHYSAISKHRNHLFHGVTSSLVSSKEAIEAISSYEWIINNFKLKEQ